MRIVPLDLSGAFRILPEPARDHRGSFARLFCAEAFRAHGLATQWVQMNRSCTAARGTVRGLHLQTAPFAEDKLVRCVSGAVFDVLVDLRPGPGQGRWTALTLAAEGGEAAYIPAGLAHGFQALTDAVELHYCHSAPFAPDHQAGLHPADPALAIPWPLPVRNLSARDAALPSLASLRELTP